MKEEYFHKVQVQYLMLNWFFLRERTPKSGLNQIYLIFSITLQSKCISFSC